MRALVLGCGMQGRAVVQDLVASGEVERVVCTDTDVEAARAAAKGLGSEKVEPVELDAEDRAALAGVMRGFGDVSERGGFDVAVDMLPRRFVRSVAEAAVEARVHLVNANYDSELRDLDGAARAAGVALLPEMGLDPGIDLVMAAEVVRRLGRVTELQSYGGGLPEPGADDNPLRYRVSWTWEGVLDSAARPARLVRGGRAVDVPPEAIFDDGEMHTIAVEPFGVLEAFPNGDAVEYAERLGIAERAREVGRYTLRWPGHCALWRAFAKLGFLSDEPVPGLRGLSPRRFLVEHLGPRLAYEDKQRDLVILRVHARGEDGGRLVFELVDRRDLESGLLAMNRTVGFAAAIAARMLASGEIRARGLLSPIRDVPWGPFVAELETRGVRITERAGSKDQSQQSQGG